MADPVVVINCGSAAAGAPTITDTVGVPAAIADFAAANDQANQDALQLFVAGTDPASAGALTPADLAAAVSDGTGD